MTRGTTTPARRGGASTPGGNSAGRDRTRNARDRVPSRGADRARAVAVRWRIGDAAARAAFGVAPGGATVEIRVSEGPGGWRGVVAVVGPGRDAAGAERVVRETAPAVAWQAGSGLIHVDAESLVHATIDVGNGTPRLLYARTPVLGELGLPGGRYEPEGVHLDNV